MSNTHYVIYTTDKEPLYDDGIPMYFVWYDIMDDENLCLSDPIANDNKRMVIANDNNRR